MEQEVPEGLHKARLAIDDVDRRLIALLVERQAVVDRVIAIKKQYNLPALIPSRVEEVISNAANCAEQSGLSPILARRIWTQLVEWFVNHEESALRTSDK